MEPVTEEPFEGQSLGGQHPLPLSIDIGLAEVDAWADRGTSQTSPMII
jgi:hypothetical protein